MKKEFMDAIIAEIEKNAAEKNLDKGNVVEFLIDAIKKTYFKKFQVDNLEVNIDLENKIFESYRLLTVVSKDNSDTYDDFCEILENDPEIANLKLNVGDIYKQPFDIHSFKRADVLVILQAFKQKIMDAVNGKVFISWKPLINTIVFGEVDKYDQRSGGYYVDLNNTSGTVKTKAFMPKKETNPNERLIEGRTYPFVVKNVIEKSNFWPVVLSRNSEKLVVYYMTEQIPEIEQGLIQIVSASRIASYKTKLLIRSDSPSINEPIAVCVGVKGSKIKTISSLIGGEKIDVYKDYKDPIKNIINIYGADKVVGIIPKYEEDNLVSVFVFMKSEDIQMALGKGGLNTKLISKLLNIYIEIDDIQYYENDDPNYIDASTIELSTNIENINNTILDNSYNDDIDINNFEFDPELISDELLDLLDDEKKSN